MILLSFMQQINLMVFVKKIWRSIWKKEHHLPNSAISDPISDDISIDIHLTETSHHDPALNSVDNLRYLEQCNPEQLGVLLSQCIKTGRYDRLEYLIDIGADIDIPGDENPLITAICSRNIIAATLLLQHGANVDVENTSGRTPVRIALLKHQEKMVELLLSYGAAYPNSDIQQCDVLSHAIDESWRRMEALNNYITNLHAQSDLR